MTSKAKNLWLAFEVIKLIKYDELLTKKTDGLAKIGGE